MAEYAKHQDELNALGIGVAALSVDSPSDSAALKASLGSGATFLCDPERQVLPPWGLLNPHERGGIAYPATFVLDRDRTVRFRSLERTAARARIDGLLEFLRAGLQSPPPPSRPRIVLPRLADWAQAIRNAVRDLRRAKK